MAIGGESSSIVYTHAFSSPVGQLHAAVDRTGRVLYVGFSPLGSAPEGSRLEENKYACGELELQLEQYFAGDRQNFSLDTKLEGTPFQRTVWSRLTKVRFGETTTYGEVARKIGRRDAARAVGNAVAANPIVVLIPCHRVLPATGGIGNYAIRTLDPGEGRRVKRLLLDLESGQGVLSE